MAGLPIVKMTLYKHGVGFFTRQGERPGETVGLEFRKEEMNDVLKSLTAVASGRAGARGGLPDAGGQGGAAPAVVHPAVRRSQPARPAARRARAGGCSITTTAGSQAGIVVGVDLPGEREPMDATVLSLYLPETREVIPVRLGDIMLLTLDDDRAAADLGVLPRDEPDRGGQAGGDGAAVARRGGRQHQLHRAQPGVARELPAGGR